MRYVHVNDIVLVPLLPTLNIIHTFSLCSYHYFDQENIKIFAGVFPCEFRNIFQSKLSTKHLRATSFVISTTFYNTLVTLNFTLDYSFKLKIMHLFFCLLSSGSKTIAPLENSPQPHN